MFTKPNRHYSQLNIGDIIYPAEDGKASRVTQCKVTKIEDKNIWVTGVFWGTEIQQTLKFTNVDYRGRECLGYWDDDTEGGYCYWLLIEEQVPEYLRNSSYYG